jgi:hypothetical protein
MKMNNTFQINRFGWLLRKAFLERKVQTFGLTALVLCISLILYSICKTFIGFGAAQNLTFIWGLAGGGCFMASLVFGYFGSNASGISYLTLPASIFEKWLTGILIGVILYPLIFLLFFRLIDAGFVMLYHNSLDPASPTYKSDFASVYTLPLDGRLALRVYNMFLIFTSISFLGSLFFNKVSFVKVALVFCAFCLFMFTLNWIIAKMFFGDIASAFPFSGVSISIGKSMNPEEGAIELPEHVFRITGFVFDYLIPVSLFALVYLRLREKEF